MRPKFQEDIEDFWRDLIWLVCSPFLLARFLFVVLRCYFTGHELGEFAPYHVDPEHQRRKCKKCGATNYRFSDRVSL